MMGVGIDSNRILAFYKDLAENANDDLARMLRNIEHGLNLFEDSDVLASRGTRVSQSDIEKARRFFSCVVFNLNPDIRPGFWFQYFRSREIGRRLTLMLEPTIRRQEKGQDRYDPETFLFLLELFSIQRALAQHFRQYGDEAAISLFQQADIPYVILEHLLSYQAIESVAQRVALEKENEENILDEYYHSLTVLERLTLFVTMLGQEENKTDRALLTIEGGILIRCRSWLITLGVDMRILLEELERFHPRFVILTRHGSIHNPIGRVSASWQKSGYMWYSRDAVMKESDWIHLDDYGHAQFEKIADLLMAHEYDCAAVWVSPETRAIESGQHIAHRFDVEIRREPLIDEAYAPGYYHSGMPIYQYELPYSQYAAYWVNLWGHEVPEDIICRFRQGYWKAALSLVPGKTCVITSHGDPITLFLHAILFGERPSRFDLYEKVNIQKGEAIVTVLHGNELFAIYSLMGKPVTSG